MVCLPLWPDRDKGDAEVRGYDLMVDTQDFQEASWKESVVSVEGKTVMRLYPKRYKESCPMRIMMHEEYLIVVLPVIWLRPRWAVYIFNPMINKRQKLGGITRIRSYGISPHVVDADPTIPLQYSLQDQIGGHFVFCFFEKEENEPISSVRSKLVTLHIGLHHCWLEGETICQFSQLQGEIPIK